MFIVIFSNSNLNNNHFPTVNNVVVFIGVTNLKQSDCSVNNYFIEIHIISVIY